MGQVACRPKRPNRRESSYWKHVLENLCYYIRKLVFRANTRRMIRFVEVFITKYRINSIPFDGI